MKEKWQSAVTFPEERWEKIKKDAKDWWAGKLSRPLIQIRMSGKSSKKPEPELPYQKFTSFYQNDIPAKDIIERWDYELSTMECFGDAFPHVRPNFGPGVLAEFLGARMENSESENTVWFHPCDDKELADLEFNTDLNTSIFSRISEIIKTADSMWKGLVQVGKPDLSGNLDILSCFRPGEKLLYDLYDCPEDVLKKISEVHELWWQAFDSLEKLSPSNPGHTCWAALYSEIPYYMLQCDFAYMIGPDMFDEFVKPELEQSCKRLGNAFYHLDGKGQLVHLDSLLSIESLKGIQWIPGAGAPDVTKWPEVYKKIREAGKLVQIFGCEEHGYRTLDIIADQLGSAEGIALIAGANQQDRDDVEKFLDSYSAGS